MFCSWLPQPNTSSVTGPLMPSHSHWWVLHLVPRYEGLRNTSEQWPFPCSQPLTWGQHWSQVCASLHSCLSALGGWSPAHSIFLPAQHLQDAISARDHHLCPLSAPWDMPSSLSPLQESLCGHAARTSHEDGMEKSQISQVGKVTTPPGPTQTL